MAHAGIDEALEVFYSGDSAGAEVLLQGIGGGKLEPPTGLAPLEEAAFYECLGGIKLAREDGPAAETAFRRMIELEEKAGAELGGHATSWGLLGEALVYADKHDESRAAFDKALKMKEDAGAEAGSLLNLLYRYSEALFRRGRYKDAAERFEKATHYAQKADADPATLATIALYHADSIKHYTGPMFLSVRMQKNMQGHNPPPQILMLEKQLEGQYRQAIGAYQMAAEQAQAAGMDPGFKLQIQRCIGEMHHDAARFVKAVMARKKVIQLAEAQKVDAKELAFMYHGLGESTKEMNQPGEAAEAFRKAISLKEKAGVDAVSIGKSCYALGECVGATGKLEAALEAFTKAKDLEEKADAKDENRKLRLKRYWTGIAQVLQALKKDDEAKAAAAKVESI